MPLDSWHISPGKTVHGKVDVGEVVHGGAYPGGSEITDVSVHKRVYALAAPIPPADLDLSVGAEPFRDQCLLRRKPDVRDMAGHAWKCIVLV